MLFLWIYINCTTTREKLFKSKLCQPEWSTNLKPTLLFPTIIHIYSVLFKPCIQRWWPRKRRKALYVSIKLFFELTNNWAFHGTGDDMAARTTWNDALNFNDNMKPSEFLARKAVISRYNGPSTPSCAWNSSDGPGSHIATSKSRKLMNDLDS